MTRVDQALSVTSSPRVISRLFWPALIILPLLSGSAAGLPDLRCGSPQLLFPPAGGAELVVPIENRGSGPAGPALIRLGRRPSPENDWTWSDLELGPLPPGGSRPLRIRLPLAAENGRMSFALLLDPEAAVAEADEQNNRLEIPAISALVPAPLLEQLPAAGAGSVSVRGRTGPGWEVQCLAGEEVVVATARGDEAGFFVLNAPLSPGANHFAFRALAAGVWPGTPVSAPPLHADADPPAISVWEPAEGGVYRAVAPRYTVDDATPAAVEASLDGKPFAGALIEEPGAHTLRLTARDAAGNVASVARRFHIDRDPPRLELAGMPEKEGMDFLPALEAKDEHLRGAGFWVDGYLWRDGLAVTAPGRHVLTAAAEDAAGNRATLRVAFTVGGRAAASAPPTLAAIAAALPAGSRPLLVRTGRVGPDPGMGAAVFFADGEDRIRLGVVPPGARPGGAWVAPARYGSAEALPRLALHLEDLDEDGAVEILAEGPGSEGRRLLILRWQAGAWTVVGDFAGRALLILRGPAGGRPVVLAETADGGRAWRRTATPSGMGAQYALVSLAGVPALAAAAADPGYAFLRPLSLAGPRAENCRSVRARGFLRGLTLALEIGPDSYRLLAEPGSGGAPEQVGPAVEGEIGPSWLWPDPDGLFLVDYDGDGEDEPCLAVRQGRSWRELRLYDACEGRLVPIYRGRVRLAERGYDPGFRFVRRAGEVLLFVGPGREEREVLRWESREGGFVPVRDAPDAVEGEVNLLGREFLSGADWLPNLW